jgi:hypothetical protein
LNGAASHRPFFGGFERLLNDAKLADGVPETPGNFPELSGNGIKKLSRITECVVVEGIVEGGTFREYFAL